MLKRGGSDMIDETCTPDDVVENILKTPIFVKGELYQDLLRYLLKCHHQNYIPTETDIATHVFGKKDNFDPTEDTLVRVYLYRLRKKLERYYSGPGKCDKIRVSIPKGQHQIEFISNQERDSKQKMTGHKIRNLLTISLILLLTIMVGLLWFQNKSLKKQLAPPYDFSIYDLIWSDFLKSELNTVFVIGDLFAFYKYQHEYDRTWLVRDDRINSKEEYEIFISQYNTNNEDTYLPGWDIVPKSAAINFSKIQSIFHPKDNLIPLRITSEITWQDIENNNIIFIGHSHNLGILKNVFPIKRIRPITEWILSKRDPVSKIHVMTEQIDTLYQVELHLDKDRPANIDYVVVSKVAGPNGNSLLFIISFFTLGRLEIVEKLTDVGCLSLLEQEIRSINKTIPPYFEMLFEVRGFKETGLKTELKHFFELPSEFQINE